MSDGAAAAAVSGGDSGGGGGEPGGLAAVAEALSGVREQAQRAGNGAGEAEGGTEPVEGGEAPTETAAEQKHRIKVAGEEREVSTDDLIRLAQKNASADRYLEQAKAQAKEIAELRASVEKAAADPLIAAYMQKGTDGLLDMVAEMLEYEQLPPEERTKVDQRRELERKAKRADELEAKERTAREEQMTQQYVQRIEAEVTAVIAASGLPETAHTVRRAAGMLEAAMLAGDKTITREKLAAALREEMSGDLRGYLGGLEPEALADLLGEEGVKKWRSWDTARLRPPTQVQRARPPATRPRAEQASARPRTSEFFKKLRGE